MISLALSLLGLAAGLTVMVTVHELGHWLAARAFGVRMYEFAVGFGPEILRTRFGGTAFSVRLVPPLGGFIRFFAPDEPGGTLAAAVEQPLRRAAIILAGPLVNMLAAGLLLTGAYLLAGLSPPVALGAAVEESFRLTSLLGTFGRDLLTGTGFVEPLPDLLAAATGTLDGTPAPWTSALRITALLGLYLGLFNLIPIPPLDGGHLALLAAEKALGQPLGMKTVGMITAVGAALMLMLAALVVYEDLSFLLSKLKN